jgi:hypothetical protein
MVPSGNGICPAVIRVENGLLGEILQTFQDVIGGFKLPIGSVIVLASAAHLFVEGLAAYAESMVDQLNKIGRIFRGGVVGLPGMPVLVGGADCPEAVRALSDLCGWLPALTLPEPGSGGLFPAALKLIKEKLVGGGDRKRASLLWRALRAPLKPCGR